MNISQRVIKSILFLCLGYAPICAFAETVEVTQRDNLLQVVRETLDANPEVQIRLEAFWASTHDEREAFGGYLPSVDLNAGAGIADRDFDGRGSFNKDLVELSLTQMLFDGFRVRSAVARTKHASRARYYELLDEAETKALESSEAYLSILRHRELVTLAQENLANHRRVQRRVSDRAGRGVANGADLKQIDGRVSLAQSNLMTEIANLQSVSARFQRLVGRFPSFEMSPFEVPESAVPVQLREVLTVVYSNNPSLFAAYEEMQSFSAAYSEVKSRRYPILELGLKSGRYKNDNGFDNRRDPDKRGDESVIELRLRYNLYRGGRDRAAERAANHRVYQADRVRDKVCVDVRQTATISHSDVLNLQVKMDSLKDHRDGAASVLDAYREQFDIGRRSLLDVLDSENEFFQSQRAYVNGFYDLHINRLRTLHSMGRLLETLSVEKEVLPDLSDIHTPENPGSSRYCTLMQSDAYDVSRYLKSAPLPKEEVMGLGSDVLFNVGSSVLKPGGVEEVQQFAQQLLVRGKLKSIDVVGHTDGSGSAALNNKLSLARAAAVRDVLIESGVTNVMISVFGVGSSEPVANNDSAAGRAMNRRVEIRVKRE